MLGQDSQCQRVRPFSAFDPASLGRLNWITPNVCNDMHDCSIRTGDNWLKGVVPGILAHMTGHDVLFLTWDEGYKASNHVVMIAAGPGAKVAFQDPTYYNHYSLLKTLEDLFGLAHLRHAGDPDVSNMFNMLD